MAIAVLCIILTVLFSGIFQGQITSLQNQISSDRSSINSLKSTINEMNSTIANMNGQLSLDPNRLVNGFSIIQITDTQFLSDSHPTLYYGLTRWIADKANPLNLTMVVHTGDIVQVANSTRDWQNASKAMMTLYNNGHPLLLECWKPRPK